MQITLHSELTNCSIWELAAMHDYWRCFGGMFKEQKCTEIESEVSKRGILDRKLIERLNYYKPIKNT